MNLSKATEVMRKRLPVTYGGVRYAYIAKLESWYDRKNPDEKPKLKRGAVLMDAGRNAVVHGLLDDIEVAE